MRYTLIMLILVLKILNYVTIEIEIIQLIYFIFLYIFL